jgi:hypothetical protein
VEIDSSLQLDRPNMSANGIFTKKAVAHAESVR